MMRSPCLQPAWPEKVEYMCSPTSRLPLRPRFGEWTCFLECAEFIETKRHMRVRSRGATRVRLGAPYGLSLAYRRIAMRLATAVAKYAVLLTGVALRTESALAGARPSI